MKIFAAIISSLLIFVSPAAASDFISGIQIWAKPGTQGIQLSGYNGNWGLVTLDRRGNLTIRNSVNLKTLKRNPAQKERKPRINVAVGN